MENQEAGTKASSLFLKWGGRGGGGGGGEGGGGGAGGRGGGGGRGGAGGEGGGGGVMEEEYGEEGRMCVKKEEWTFPKDHQG